MSRTIRLLPEAREEFDQATDWYEERCDGLGVEFVRKIREVFKRIAANPRLHAKVHGEVRKAVVSKFPFLVYYREEIDVVLIISVFHASQDPAIWKSRVR